MGFRFNALTGNLDLVTNQVYKKIKYTIPAMTSAAVDIVPLSSFSSVDYSASFKTSTKNRGLKIFVSKAVSGIKELVFAKVGDFINIEVTTSISGSDLLVNVQNQETTAVDIVITRALL